MLIPLSPMDYYFLRKYLYCIQFIFEFAGEIEELALRKSIFEAVQVFPAMRSCLESRGDEFFLRPLAVSSPEEVSMRCVRLSGDFDIDNPEDQLHLIDPVVTAPGEVLLKLTLGLAKGRSFLSVSLSHLVGDGYSLFRFLTAISDAHQGSEVSPPSNDRRLLERASASPGSVDADRLFLATGYVRPRPLAPLNSRRQRIFLSNTEVQELKREARSAEFDLSTNHVLMAELLRRFHRSIPLHQGELIVRCPVDYRGIHPSLIEADSDYFGNAVRDAVACFDPEVFHRLSLSDIGIRIRDSIRRVDASEVQRSLDCLRDLRLQDGPGVFESLGCPGLLVSNLSRMPLQKMDYGCGAPVRLVHVSLFPRLAAILSHPEGVEIFVQAPTEGATEESL